MNRPLFPVQYSDDYEQVYRLYRSRAEMPSCMRKSDGYAAWIKTRNIRPELPIMLLCVSLYLDQLEGTKRVRQNGRDSKVEYCAKLHLSTYLNKMAWQDFVERATASKALSQIAPTEAQTPAARSSFKATDYFSPPRTSPLKPISQILAEKRERDAVSKALKQSP